MSDAKTRRKAVYIAEARVAGGRARWHGATSDGALRVQLRCPTEMGDEGGGTNPEQLFAVGYAACFRSALGAVARREGVDLDDVEVDSEVMLLRTDDGGSNFAVQVHVTLPSIEREDRAVELVRAAHLLSAYSSATRGNIDLELTANDAPVDGA
jgi:lipoyl-dependent peroxiredoxin